MPLSYGKYAFVSFVSYGDSDDIRYFTEVSGRAGQKHGFLAEALEKRRCLVKKLLCSF